MTRYQQLSINRLHSCAEQLWDEIKIVCKSQEKGYRYELVSKTSFGPIARIIVDKRGIKPVIVVLAAQVNNDRWEKIYVANIMPQDPTSDRLSHNEYNKILGVFKEDIIDKALIAVQCGELELSPADYTINDCIPATFDSFYRWISAYPLSYHPNDMENWYTFVSELHKNGEELGLDDFENSLTQDYRWSLEDAEKFSSMLSDELALLEVYDRMRE